MNDDGGRGLPSCGRSNWSNFFFFFFAEPERQVEFGPLLFFLVFHESHRSTSGSIIVRHQRPSSISCTIEYGFCTHFPGQKCVQNKPILIELILQGIYGADERKKKIKYTRAFPMNAFRYKRSSVPHTTLTALLHSHHHFSSLRLHLIKTDSDYANTDHEL